jgi:predicted tellurium resistance membrane protein TerC
MIRLIDYLQERIRTVIWTCYGLLAFIAVFALLVDRGHAHTSVERALPVFWSLFGFAAAAIIIGVAYWYGRSGIQARTNYYDCPLKKNCPSSEDE